MTQTRSSKHGFTLIELLVVISIIALLMAILLPVLGAARRDAELIQSISNLRQIGVATSAYSADRKGDVPITPVRQGGSSGFCTWSFGGKFASSYWADRSFGLFDIAPDSHPLNSYLYPGPLHPPATSKAGTDGYKRPANDSQRTDVELDVFKSPRDIATMQRAYPNITPGISCYDDVGSSYHYNVKWYYQLRDRIASGDRLQKSLDMARDYMKKEINFQTSRLVIYNDQVVDVIKTGSSSGGLTVVDSDYGLENFSAMVFFDGHAAFEEVTPNADSGVNYDLTFDLK